MTPSPSRVFSPFGVCAVGTAHRQRADSGASTPRPALQAHIDKNYGGQTSRDFGETGSDKYFTHTFELGGAMALSGGFLQISITSGGHNDAIGIGVNYPHGPRWVAHLSALGIGVGQTATLQLDLSNVNGSGTNLVPAIAAEGHLDIAVQDDSTVHFAEVTFCEAPFGSCVVGQEIRYRADAGSSAPRPDVQAWINANYQGQRTRGFGETGHDKYFSHSISLPGGISISGAYLEVLVTNGDHNDSLTVAVDWPTGPRWTSSLVSLGVAVGETKPVQLDLADLPNGILQALVNRSTLDVLVQDDSVVHHVELTVCKM